MMEGKKDEEKLYHAMLKGMIKQLKEKNIEVIQADLEGYKQPEIIEKNKPDILGMNKDGKPIIIKVVTETTIKFKEFSKVDGEFWVEVPESSSKEIAEKIKEWKTPVNKWFVGRDI